MMSLLPPRALLGAVAALTALTLAPALPVATAVAAEAPPRRIEFSIVPTDPDTRAPDFVLRSTDGQRDVRLSDSTGKVRLVNFWATWCGYCKLEVPDLTALQTTYQGRGLEVIGLAVDEDARAPERFMTKAKATYTSLMATEAVQAAYGGIESVPTTFVIDRQGRLIQKIEGLRDKAYFEKVLQKYL